LAAAERIRAALRARSAANPATPDQTTSESVQRDAPLDAAGDDVAQRGAPLDGVAQRESHVRATQAASLEPAPPQSAMLLGEPAREMKLDDDGDLARIGGWLVGLGTLGLLTGAIMMA